MNNRDVNGLLLTKEGVRPQDIADRTMLETAIRILDEDDADFSPSGPS